MEIHSSILLGKSHGLKSLKGYGNRDKDLLDSLFSQLRCITKARKDMQLLLSINSDVLKAICLTQ